MCNNQFISECLEFQGWKIENGWICGHDLYLRLVPVDSNASCCSICGDVVTRRKGCLPERTVRHLSQWHRMTYVMFSQRRFLCKKCRKVVPEYLDWIRPYRRHTVMFEQLCASLCDKFAVTDVALHMKIDKMALYEIDAAWIGHRNDNHRVSLFGIRYIGIDEIMIRREEVKALVKIPVPLKRHKNKRGAKRRMRKRKFSRSGNRMALSAG